MRNILCTQRAFFDYIDVLKPRETALLTFIGVCAAVIAANGKIQTNFFVLIVIAILLGSAGANGLTNYFDRRVDTMMERTCHRALPSGRISPPSRVMPLIISLLIIALVLAWTLNPLCFAVGLIGIISSIVWRKTVSCTFLGIIASCSPVLIGWLAIKTTFDIEILLICCLVAIWIPIHIWNVMIASREDYMAAGLNYFPLNLHDKTIAKILFGLSIFLCVAAMLLYRFGDFGLFYLVISSTLSAVMIYANARLLSVTTSSAAWRIYKLSAFPYLGIMFLAMGLDRLLM